MRAFGPSLVSALFALASADALAEDLSHVSDARVRQLIIEEAIARYPGNCPCPYNVARNGSRCGGRSAYSRAGGHALPCFETDVTAEMIAEYRRQRR